MITKQILRARKHSRNNTLDREMEKMSGKTFNMACYPLFKILEV